MATAERREGRSGSTALLSVVIVITILYFARVVFIPLALAVLFSFLLAPIVVRLTHWGLGRVLSVVLVVASSFVIIATIGMIVFSQMTDLAHKLPQYQQNVQLKLDSLRDSGGGLITRITRVVRDFSEKLTPPAPAPTPPRANEEKPVPVEIRRAPFAPMELIQKLLGGVLNTVLMAGIVVVFVIFMLIQREDLRDRLYRLLGTGRVNLTTQALDDATGRLSRYLLTQLFLNALFAVPVGIGLYFIGVPNPLLWAMLAFILRYVPYLGIWIAGAMPAAVAFAVDPGWADIFLIFGLYFGTDLIMYNFLEPLLYGSSTGITPMAILVAAVFWTWLWGPVGLLLATPLTVCVVVVGRYVPRLNFLSVMLSDEEVLQPHTRYYQRLLAMDLEEAVVVAEEYLQDHSLDQLYDDVVVPALSLAEDDRHCGRLDPERQKFILQNTRFLVDELLEPAAESIANGQKTESMAVVQRRESNGKSESPKTQDEPVAVLCAPARDEADEVAALMLARLLKRRGIAARSLPSGCLASECLEHANSELTKLVCVVSVPPFGYTHCRYLCHRLHAELPEKRIMAAVLTEREVAELKNRQPPLIADEITSSLQQTVAAIVARVPVEGSEEIVQPEKVSA